MSSNGHTCTQASRLLRIESEAATLRRKYCARDDAMRTVLLEIGGEIAATRTTLSEALRELSDTVASQLKELRARVSLMADEVSNGNKAPKRRRR